MDSRESQLGRLEDEDELHEDLWVYLQTLRRQLPLVLVVAGACTLLATLRTLRLPAVYAATASLRLVREPPDPIQAKYAYRWDGIPQEYLNSEIRDMTSLSLARAVIESNSVIARQLAEDIGSEDPNALAMAFLAGVDVHPEETTYVVDVTYTSSHEERCALYANALAEAYTRQRKSLWGQKTRQTEASVAVVVSRLGATLAASRKKLEEFLSSNQTPLFERQEELLIQQIDANNRALEAVRRDRIALDASLETIRRVLEQGRPLDMAPPVAQSPVVSMLRRNLAEAELELAGLEQRYGENWPQVRAARARRDQLKLLLRQEIDTILGQLESQRQQRLSEEEGLSQRAQQLREQSRQLARRARLYESLKKEVEANERFYEEFIQQQKDISAYSRVNVAEVRIVDPALAAVRVGPNHVRNVLVGALLGLFAGVLAALGLDRFSDRVRSLAEAQRLGPPVLGAVPELSDVSGRELDRYALSNPSSAYAEAFRRARVQLNATGAFPSEGCGVLVCVSGVPREGKTLCSVNLAVAEAQAGRRTLLVDGDMRNPRVHKVFAADPAPGLRNALEEGEGLEFLQSTDVENLYLLPAGQGEENAANLLGSGEAFARLIGGLRQRFDRIVIDTPPVAAFSDGVLMAVAADAVVLVVSARTSRRSASQLAVVELSRVGREPVGVILNQRPGSDYGYYYGDLYYGYGYGYGPSQPPARAGGSGA
ncbi:MAG: polysaccharide biosynthesis tyrosine autokinase [Planctomycetota bacterium]|nr:MAG: polysaccharide biosynthesis tyrosine autokinase [Planctomycetota bacterium]